MSSVRAVFGIHSPVVRKGFIAGMECEIENIRSSRGVNEEVWNITEDGSLRNNGREYITRNPSSRQELIEAFVTLHAGLFYNGGDEGSVSAFTDRTSTHVHINCLDLETEQVKSILHFYAMFEPLFFRMVDRVRANNIHCVALSETILSEYYRRPVDQLVSRWSKYTALNLSPLATIGTLEFRHLQGTNDPILVNEWLSTIENLWSFAQTTTLTRKWFSNVKNIDDAFQAIFKDSSIIRLAPYVHTLIQDSLTDVKLAFH